jgi:hypothetical protein
MTHAREKKSVPVPGHKRSNVSYGVKVECECGKCFGPYYGKDASANAHAEWRGHVDGHRKTKESA